MFQIVFSFTSPGHLSTSLEVIGILVSFLHNVSLLTLINAVLCLLKSFLFIQNFFLKTASTASMNVLLLCTMDGLKFVDKKNQFYNA